MLRIVPRRQVRGALIVLIVLAIPCACAAGTSRSVEVSARDYDVLAVPVSVSVPVSDSGIIVRASDTGAVVPCQIEKEGSDLRVTWMVEKLQAGRIRAYSIESADEQASSDLDGVELKKGNEGVDVVVNGRLFTRYVFTGVPKPYCYPVIGPTGKMVTRSYPMEGVPRESTDHKHHRSFWFTFGDVNGIDFWSESPKAGKIVHREFEKLVSGPVYGLIRSRNDWIAPDGKKVCEDVRELRVYRTTNGRLMDFDVTIRATDGRVELGDTKEGMMAFRVASSMEVDRGRGHIENSRGHRDKSAWGKQAEWCDYYGPVDGKTVGIAVMNHPSSFRHPTYWHVRTYGLLAANPFGMRAFTRGSMSVGRYIIPAGGAVTFRYRIFIHEGSAHEAKVADVYAAYADPPTVTIE